MGFTIPSGYNYEQRPKKGLIYISETACFFLVKKQLFDRAGECAKIFVMFMGKVSRESKALTSRKL